MSKIKNSYLARFSVSDYLLSTLRFRKISKYIWDGCNLLDIGCGFNGYLLHFYSKKIKSGIGLDILVNERKNNKNIQLKIWDLNTEVFPDLGEFDIVTCLAVLEHVDSPNNLIKNIYNSLKSNGVLLLTAPSWKAKPILEFLAFKIKLIDSESIADHKRYFNKEELVNLCKEAGFSKIEHNYFQFGLNNMIYAKK